MDGASNLLSNGAGLILANPEGVVAEYALHFTFQALNNQVEYGVLLARLRIAKKLGVRKLRMFTNSQLVARRTKGEFED